MEAIHFAIRKDRHRLYQSAYFLAVFTIAYNIAEGLISEMVSVTFRLHGRTREKT